MKRHLQHDGSSLPNVFLLYFAESITLLEMETNKYYYGHLERIDDGPSPLSYVTEAEMLVSCDSNTNGSLHTG